MNRTTAKTSRKPVAEMLEPRQLLVGDWSQTRKLDASDAAVNDNLGRSVAVSGNFAVAGSPGDDDYGFSSGSAYVYNVTTGAQVRKLLPNDGAEYDFFGTAVALSGNIALIGSTWDDDNGNYSGSAYLFNINTGAQIAKLKPSDGSAGDYFGSSVAINGDIALIGATGDAGSGSAYLFRVSTGVQIAKLMPLDVALNDNFGVSAAISGNTAIVGSYLDDDFGSASGSAYLFNATNGTQIAKLTPTDSAAGDYFGISVGLSGNFALVGSPRDDDNGSNSGSAYLFNATTGAQIRKLKPQDGGPSDAFGSSVSVSNNIALVGSRDDSDNGPYAGSAYLFNASTGVETQKLVPTGGASYDQFGGAVAISGGVAVIGSMYGDNTSGSAFLFTGLIEPNVISATFDFEYSQNIRIRFDQVVTPTLSNSDLTVRNDATNQVMSGAFLLTSTSSTSTSGSWSFFAPNLLPDGDYTAILSAGSVSNSAGLSNWSDAIIHFHILTGDLNRDRSVNFDDLLILAQNYDLTGRTYSQGNVNYSADGKVDFDDLLILAQQYGSSLFSAKAIAQPAAKKKSTGRAAELLN